MSTDLRVLQRGIHAKIVWRISVQAVLCFSVRQSLVINEICCISVYFCTLCMQLLLIITQEANLYENLICLYQPEIFNQIKKCFNYTRRYLRTYVPSFHIEKKEKRKPKAYRIAFFTINYKVIKINQSTPLFQEQGVVVQQQRQQHARLKTPQRLPC